MNAEQICRITKSAEDQRKDARIDKLIENSLKIIAEKAQLGYVQIEIQEAMSARFKQHFEDLGFEVFVEYPHGELSMAKTTVSWLKAYNKFINNQP